MFANVTPITDTVGVEITGIEGSRLADAQAAARCRALLDMHGVVVFRDAHIADADLVALSRMLGDVVVAPLGGQEKHPEISAISLDPATTVLASYNKGTFHWHIDGATDAVPQKSTLLTALEVSEEGGDTEFANTYASYEALTEDEKASLAELRVVHSFAAAQLLANPDPSDKQRAAWARVPTREHPLIWTRRNGRKSLLLGATAAHVVGWPEEQGGHFSTVCSTGRRNLDFLCDIIGVAATWSYGTTPECCTAPSPMRPPHPGCCTGPP